MAVRCRKDGYVYNLSVVAVHGIDERIKVFNREAVQRQERRCWLLCGMAGILLRVSAAGVFGCGALPLLLYGVL